MKHTVKEVAKASGVSVRTLHYYDEIGLLTPQRDETNGYRCYGEEELLRLQQILFFRELDFPLEDIRSLLGSDSFDRIGALEEHKRLLALRAERLRTLMNTIDQTIGRLKGERTMNRDELYEGFDQSKQKQYEREIIQRYGKQAEKHIEESRERMKTWTKEDYDRVNGEYAELNRRMTSVLESGLTPDSPEAQGVVEDHFGVVSRFYTPSREMYAGLGDLYTDHPDFRKLYDAFHPRLADYWRDAMKAYAASRLS
ncbi:transcriptional regulator SkgA, mercury resistance [Paenibacillus mucilaginosus 3016]|uniref:Transcriptional regulator SkgA, mercury resistance n=2 Tax=Paenibacillus mucilaginosus TaxID=61624 RepID=H6NBG0_9BACL|nr:MerR family transcriptional regulator [Paenibacillus mucilaginosus]AFC32906.1 transcriptional regulator SkgA, mercury resistance [Paenibacillus mucilaginosus 3016]AFH65216.1 transcriptional regulator [Paenibacillus mucilaginosus K02]WFA21355.1 MerR family transcriptional regulator [Paenibacillus mucilaginosus]